MNIKNQYEGFINTPILFEEALQIGQFDLSKVHSTIKENIDLNFLNSIPSNIPLGKRLEYFFEYFIDSSTNYKILAKNIQIFQNNQTLGEIDFILKDLENNKFYHIEFVYKYYLYFEKEDELECFMGPNLNDSLIKKLTKLKDKQFSILKHRKTQNILEKIDARDIIQKTVFLGNIYLPRNKDFNFEIINNACKRGFYTSINEFKTNIQEYKEYKYFLPHRFDWVVNPSQSETWKSYNEILDEVQEFIDLNKSPLVWMKTKEKKYLSFFITYYEIT